MSELEKEINRLLMKFGSKIINNKNDGKLDEYINSSEESKDIRKFEPKHVIPALHRYLCESEAGIVVKYNETLSETWVKFVATYLNDDDIKGLTERSTLAECMSLLTELKDFKFDELHRLIMY